MSNDRILTDEYVAGVLAEEAARDCSLKFSAMGMEASRADKKQAPAAQQKEKTRPLTYSRNYRPNTMFLERIIKGTDTHNKAKLANQAAESQARLKELEIAEELKRLKSNPNASEIRKRQMGAIHAILGDKKRGRDGDDGPEAANPEPKNRNKPEKTENLEKRHRDHRSSNRERDLFRDGRDESKRHRFSQPGHKRDSGLRKDDGRSSGRNRDDDSSRGENSRTYHSRSRRERSESPRRHGRSRSPGERKSKHRQRSRDRSPSKRGLASSRRTADGKRDDDSDYDLIGPAPPPRRRGRGTIGGASSLDHHFSESYDPKTDVHMESDEETWEDAVEAYRDLQKLRQNQEQRMKAAGFAEEQIRKVNSRADDIEQHVVWSKAGEKRAWDKGKALEDEDMDDTPDILSGSS
ncbi:hypothetical protein TOPH_08008 [Tolypocladium ophioglossoides CBS 100239]|uniref:Pre-mRNA-splicing factor 38B n=1 Tax=Tolypocladium ophioglossoides (strain CBS 100239) TaxID=1163406 RepID=A0A0L0N020_TOLOC|nr:hypothetical protein TOPH_08008 [Tolypocladium ophioglossoides CBS 100239]